MNNVKTFGLMVTALFVLALVGGTGQATISGSGQYFTTNYTDEMGIGNYSKGGDTLTFYITVADAVQDPGALGSGSNVSIQIYDATPALYATVYLDNETTDVNGTWSGTWSAPSAEWANTSYVMFVINDSSGQATYNISNFGVDDTNPSSSGLTVGGTSGSFTWKGRTGASKTVSVTATDNLNLSTATVDFTSVPSGSSQSDASMTCGSGSTSRTCTYTFTPDVIGDYTFRIATTDVVTNSNNGDSVTIRFTLRDSEYPFGATGSGSGSGSQTVPTSYPSSPSFSITDGSGNPINVVIDGIMSIPAMLMSLFEPILSLFG